MAPLTGLPGWFREPRRAPCVTPGNAGHGCAASHATERFLDRTLMHAASFAARLLDTEESASRAGLLQSVDARARLAGTLLLISGAAISTDAAYMALLLGAAAVLSLASAVSPLCLAKRAAPAVLFTALIALPVVTETVTPGSATASAYGVVVTREGLNAWLLFTLRVAAMVSLTSLFLLTTRQTGLFSALGALGVPAFFVTALYMTLCYVFILIRVVEDSALARKSRYAGRPDGLGARAWFSSRAGLILNRSMKTADDVAMAMASRGFGGRIRTAGRGAVRARDFVWPVFAAFVFFLSFGL